MIHLRHEVDTDPLDIDALIAAIPAALQAVRDLDIGPDGVQPRSGGPRRMGLLVAQGTHPQPGTRYRHTEIHHLTVDGEARERVARTDVELLADRPDLGQVAWSAQAPTPPTRTVASVEPRDQPRMLTVDIDGPVRGSIVVDLAHLTEGHNPQIEVELLHRFAAGAGTVHLSIGPNDRWRWMVRAEARGAGLLRPVAAIGLLIGGRRIRREAAKAIDQTIVEGVAQVRHAFADLDATGTTPAEAAAGLIDEWVDQLLVTVDPSLDGSREA